MIFKTDFGNKQRQRDIKDLNMRANDEIKSESMEYPIEMIAGYSFITAATAALTIFAVTR